MDTDDVCRRQPSEVNDAGRVMKRHACRSHYEEFTYSSIAEHKDNWAPCGKFRFDDDENAREELARAMATI